MEIFRGNTSATSEIEFDIEVDETLFTQEIRDEFNESIYYVGEDIQDHVANIVTYLLKGTYDTDDFFEGYGYMSEIGVTFKRMKFHTYDDVVTFD